jgi:hypothetical protein
LRYRELKKRVRAVLEGDEMDDLASLIEGYPRALSALISLTYDRESLITWRAVESIGPIVKKITDKSYEAGRNIARRLLWSITEESGGIGWTAIEMIGEIVRCNPVGYNDFVPIIVELYEEEIFRPGVLYAIGKIGESQPELLRETEGVLIKALKDKDPYIRCMALLTYSRLSKIGRRLSISDTVKELFSDSSRVKVYNDGEMREYVIGELAKSLI